MSKVVGNIIDVLTTDKEIKKTDSPEPCRLCALRIQRQGKLDCMIPLSMCCPLNDGEYYAKKS